MKLTFAFFAALALSAYSQTVLPVKTDATGLVVYPVTSAAFKSANSIGSGTGTVTSVSVATANGVSGTVATATTTPAITLVLGAITPSSVNGLTLTGGTNTFTLTLGTSSLTVPAGVAFNANALLNVLANNTSTSANFNNVDASFHRVNGIFISGTATKQLTLDNSLEFAGTDSTVMTFPSTSATIARTDAANTFTGHQTIEGVTSTGATGTAKLVFSAAPTVTGILSLGAVAGLTLNESGAITQPSGFFSVDSSGNVASGAIDASGFNIKGGGFYALSGAAGKYLVLQNTETLTANRALTITLGDAARTLTLSGSPSLSGITTTGTGTIATTAGQTYIMPSTSATIARTDAAQTFTGVQSMTSPDITTSITTPSATFALANTTATTVNFAGAATTVIMATSNSKVSVGGATATTSSGATAPFLQLGDGVSTSDSTHTSCLIGLSNQTSTADRIFTFVAVNSSLGAADKRIGQFGFATDGATNTGKFNVSISSAGSMAFDVFVVRPTAISLGVATTVGSSGISITNIRHGVSGAMTAGSVTVTDTGCTANTRYFFTTHTIGTITIPSSYYASTRTPSTSFVITSSQVTDTSTVDWFACEP